MRIYCLICAFLLISVFSRCGSFKKDLLSGGAYQNVFKNAILDFSNTCWLYKKDSVFSISVDSDFYTLVSERMPEGIYRSVKQKSFPDLIVLRIAADYNQYLVKPSTKIGAKNSKLPTRFIETNGKLFYWWDDNYPLTREAMEIFKKYDLLYDDKDDKIQILDPKGSHDQKAAHYYFCRNNLTRYKKVITNKGLGYYLPPRLKCNPEN